MGAVKGLLAHRQEIGTHARGPHDRAPSPAGPRPGDPADVGALFAAYGDLVARWVARLGGPLVDVEDAVQEVFLVAQRRRPTLDGPARISTWLYRVTAKVVSHRRRKDRIRRWLGGSGADVAERMPAADQSPSEALEAREKLALVYRILDRLPERQRAVILLFEMEGLSGEEIAALMGAKVATVWVWLHRARGAFLARLAEHDAAERARAARGSEEERTR